ncbi:hypothetical protein JCM19046_4649 [Bacillus sp. JCM 19046]|nr:hypothetical protein JCM19045_4428 [Bacillus sp. JCM 19045]GAF19954.1 hypothetical protein JCM19046_4649 [Bacillus sp. JCM 19046]
MDCFCDGNTTSLKLEGDVGADPFWCMECGCNLELEDLPLSGELKAALAQWAEQYGNWIDWNKDQLLPDGVMREDHHNQEGRRLSAIIKGELKNRYDLQFIPSSMARMYASRSKLRK